MPTKLSRAPAPVTSFGLKTVTRVDDMFVDDQGKPFDAEAYSRFKYGDPVVAELYGNEVARSIEERVLARHPASEPAIVTASAYKHLPTAADAVVRAAWTTLSSRGYLLDFGRIHRANLTRGDYAAMSADERLKVMESNSLYIDGRLFHGHHVVVVDDIKITGAHEGSVSKLFAGESIASLTHMHVVRMDPELVARDPAVEHVLNGTWMTGLDRLRELIRVDPARYLFNARTAKMVLGREEDELEGFFLSLGDWHIRQLYAGSIGDGYNVTEPYKAGFSCLHREAARRGIVMSEVGI